MSYLTFSSTDYSKWLVRSVVVKKLTKWLNGEGKEATYTQSETTTYEGKGCIDHTDSTGYNQEAIGIFFEQNPKYANIVRKAGYNNVNELQKYLR